MLDRFTDEARRVLGLAQEEVRTLYHNHIGSTHLLLGLLREGASLRRCSTVSAWRLNRSDASSAT